MCVKALRRAELCSLDVEHFNTREGRLSLLGKGKSERQKISWPPHCAGAIRNCDRNPASAGGCLTPNGLYKLVSKYGREIGLKLALHKLRHSAITIFLDNSNGNVLEAQGLSRHKDIRTLGKYDDNRKDRGDQASALLEDLIDG